MSDFHLSLNVIPCYPSSKAKAKNTSTSCWPTICYFGWRVGNKQLFPQSYTEDMSPWLVPFWVLLQVGNWAWKKRKIHFISTMLLRLKLQLILWLQRSPHVRENPLCRRKSESQQLLYSSYSQRGILIRELISVKEQWCEGPARSAQYTHWGFTEFRYIQYLLCWLYPVCPCMLSSEPEISVSAGYFCVYKMHLQNVSYISDYSNFQAKQNIRRQEIPSLVSLLIPIILWRVSPVMTSRELFRSCSLLLFPSYTPPPPTCPTRG